MVGEIVGVGQGIEDALLVGVGHALLVSVVFVLIGLAGVGQSMLVALLE